MNGPLDGVRILDLTSVVMGPYCTSLLADMGADVIKIENLTGDSTRYLGPSKHQGMGSLFLHLNRNKRSVTLNLKKEEEKAALLELVKEADVFVHTMRPKAIEKLGLSYEHLNSLNSRLIYCGMYGFSKKGLYKDKPAYDDIIQAASGIAAAQGKITGDPQYLATVLADKTAGLFGLSAILSALYHREQNGYGQEIEVPMFETIVSYTMLEHMYGKTYSPALGPAYYSRVTSPNRKPYKTKDGFISVLIYNDKHWKTFFEVADRKELINDKRFSDMTSRTEHIDFVYGTVEETLLTKTTEEWLSLLNAADIPCTKVNTPDDLFEDPHLNSINFFESVQHPTEGEIWNMKFPVTFSKNPLEVNRYAPNLGEHNNEVLNELGWHLKQKNY
ncbi:CaiB/BaiF CoA transferase family protein [Oceanobacillus polygoni]|uniref:Crotonobetainyl-CoA:carnitine CoA-transferase CaiB-like acyl-CoA transferase n=2 Tax=Oceanobacillus polygoni TaxID=1235259 RepID=A0A9X0YNJ0_9BACI|nr:CoA transferase [Oceanobacillus polygoni]MBP2075859.1 crotonobetainyl-CoA:carnitine CoA-transferase CaiB-like acyl-CoA transferase [Oceanobacillus polygoni]